jgi:methyl-accepting chemotaxis protein
VTWFNNLRVGAKLLAGFLAVSLITAAVGLMGIRNMSRINALNDRLYQQELLGLSYAKEANINLIGYGRAMRNVLLASTVDERDAARRMMAQRRELLLANLDSARATSFTEQGKALLASIAEGWTAFEAASEPVIAASLEEGLQNQRRSMELLVTARQKSDAVDSIMTALSELRVAQAATAADQATAIYAQSRRYMILLVLGSILSGIGIGLGISRRISRSIRSVAECAEQVRTQAIMRIAGASESMARGDLSTSVSVELALLPADASDEIGDLARSMNGIIGQSQSAAGAFDRALGTLREVIGETEVLIGAAQRGQLDTRGDETRFEGGYRDIVRGLNHTLDAVVTPLTEANTVLARVAERDLTARMTGEYAGDFAAMQTSLNLALDNLVSALGEVEAATTQVATAGDQISGGSQALAEGASEQASSLEEVSSSLQEMAAMSTQSAANAGEARTLAEATSAGTAESVATAERLSAAMDRIKQSSDQTAKILKTIDEIAFQTNLLALNAAVEAARAGDAGRGFAVVAEEVRALALRSAEAAKSTAELIDESVRNAQAGVTLNSEVLAKLGEISRQAERVNTVVAEITAASEQQAQGVQQINVAVEQMNAVTQQVAANAEESAAAATELASQAAHMRDVVGTFQLDSGAAGPSAPTRARAATPARQRWAARPEALAG